MTFRSKLPEGEREAAKAARRLKRLRDRHHILARMIVAGFKRKNIAERMGYSPHYITWIQQDPAFKDLLAHYRAQLDEAFIAGQDAYYDLMRQNMVAAERMISDRLADADEDEDPIPLKDLLSISRDAADRTGYGKKSMQVNVNVDFAARLDRAVRRSKAGTGGLSAPVSPHPSALPSFPAPGLSPVEVFGGGPKLLQLEAVDVTPSGSSVSSPTPAPETASFSFGLRRRTKL